MVKKTKQKVNDIVRLEEISKEEARFRWEYHKITEGVITILETPQDAYQKNEFGQLKSCFLITSCQNY